MSFWRPEVTSLSGRFLNFKKKLGKPKVNKTIIPFGLVGYEIGDSQLGLTGLVG